MHHFDKQRANLEKELLKESEEFCAEEKITFLFNKHITFYRQDVTLKRKKDSSYKIAAEIISIESSAFSDVFNLKKYNFLLNIFAAIDNVNLTQKYSTLFLQYWEPKKAVYLPLTNSIIGFMKAIRCLENIDDIKNRIIELDLLILIHPTASILEKKLVHLIKLANIIEISVLQNILFNKFTNKITFEKSFKYILDLKFKNYNLQSFLYRYLVYCLHFNLRNQ